jgi:hypothetical protein
MKFDFLTKALKDTPKQEPYAAKIESKLLNDTLVVFKGKENFKQVKQDYPGEVIYFEKEIEILDGADHDMIKGVHAIKKVFDNSWLKKIKKKER